MARSLAIILAIIVFIPGSSAQNNDGAALLEYEKNTISVFDKVAPSVVFITNKTIRRDFFTLNAFEIPQGSGSGFIWDKQGHVVTNFHVIQNASVLIVTLSDQSTYRAKVVGAEPSKDLAVLKIDAPEKKLKPVEIGTSDKLRVGQKVVAIGNPFGLDQTLTVGVVSALGREINAMNNRKIHNVIQTDAAINPGNSGGPLLDSHARLIGVNTAIYSPSGTNAGIGFAVPVNTVRWIVPQLIKFGKVIRPGLGVTIVDDSITKRMGVKGIIVGQVQPGSGAETAGLQGLSRNKYGRLELGDIIVKVNGKPVTNYDELSYALEKCKIGEFVEVEYLRDKVHNTAKVKLQRLN